MDTILTKRYPVTKKEFTEIVAKKVRPLISQFVSEIDELERELKKLCLEKQQIRLLGRNMYLDTREKTVFPDFRLFEGDAVTDYVNENFEEYFQRKLFGDTLQYELPTSTQLREKAGLLRKFYDKGDKFVCICNDKRRASYNMKIAFDPFSETISRNEGETAIVIPILNLQYTNPAELLVNYLVLYGMCPDGLSAEMMNCLSDLIEIKRRFPDSLTLKENKVSFCGGEYLVKEFETDSDKLWIDNLRWAVGDILKQIYESKNIGGINMNTKEDLLNCEKIRADIEPYDEMLLTDPNRGHWDLWLDQDAAQSQFTVEMSDDMVARNPICDINENGVIAIDFGTKSTVVVYQSDIEHSLPMGIGDGNLSKEPSPRRYENPTVMHFVDLESFLSDYASEKGRPKTKWENLTISHTAMEQFKDSKSEEYYEYLHEIKQWAGQREKQFRIQSHDRQSYILPAFLDLGDDDWNPIEFYAYYIGLYINNMRKGHGIFLDYYLSFPVTYEAKIREKIIQSFEKGLKKSLPISILENEEIMKKFHVNGEISEPAAYAVCALQEYGFEPEGNDEIFYGIFDFGGGTTDFDFGLWKESSKRRYDYAIENFGAGGDEYLGGENLLEMLAFEVFKENQAMMREKGFTFALAPKCTEFLGSDALLADSQEAEKNMHNLMEKIRPCWEGITSLDEREVNRLIKKIEKALREVDAEYLIYDLFEEIDKKEKEAGKDDSSIVELLNNFIKQHKLEIDDDDEDDDEIEFIVTLFGKDGKDYPNVKLNFSKHKMEKIIEDRIRDGVNNFFSALLLSYQNEKVKKPATVNILLAGNSCKSPVVKKVFEEVIAEQEQQIKEKYKIKDKVDGLFEIFPPLGTEEAYNKMESRGLTPSRDDFEKPTGKTGVAFGLIQCRVGGTIERITNIGIEDEIPFQYFIGWRSKKKFVLFRDDSKITKYQGKPDYNEWYKFIEADDSVFDLYYTTLPECVSGELMVDGNAAVKRLRCEIDVVDEDAFVYIRAVNPHTLEYVVAKTDDIDSSKLGDVVRKEL